jgi:hypothetical protein
MTQPSPQIHSLRTRNTREAKEIIIRAASNNGLTIWQKMKIYSVTASDVNEAKEALARIEHDAMAGQAPRA